MKKKLWKSFLILLVIGFSFANVGCSNGLKSDLEISVDEGYYEGEAYILKYTDGSIKSTNHTNKEYSFYCNETDNTTYFDSYEELDTATKEYLSSHNSK